jgi:hypothetical protein
MLTIPGELSLVSGAANALVNVLATDASNRSQMALM